MITGKVFRYAWYRARRRIFVERNGVEGTYERMNDMIPCSWFDQKLLSRILTRTVGTFFTAISIQAELV